MIVLTTVVPPKSHICHPIDDSYKKRGIEERRDGLNRKVFRKSVKNKEEERIHYKETESQREHDHGTEKERKRRFQKDVQKREYERENGKFFESSFEFKSADVIRRDEKGEYIHNCEGNEMGDRA